MDSRYEELIYFLKKLGIENITKGEKKILINKLSETSNIVELKKELDRK